jgi:hypothetical protein
MQNEDQSGTRADDEVDQEGPEAGMERQVGHPTNVVSFSSPQQPAADVANHESGDDWPFDDVDVPSYSDDYGTTTETAITLVVPAPRPLDADSCSSGQVPEWRVSLYWRDARQRDPEGLILTDADGQVLDLAMFRTLRDRLGAWVSCIGQEREVLAALHCAAYRADEPGIGAHSS